MSIPTSSIERLVGEASSRRHSLRSSGVFRLFDGAGDGFPGLSIDRLGSVAIVHLLDNGERAASMAAELRSSGPDLLPVLEAESVYLRLHRPDARSPSSPELLCGARVERAVIS